MYIYSIYIYVYVCEGPRLPSVRRRIRPDIDGELYDTITDQIIEAACAQELFATLRGLLVDRPISWTRLQRTLTFIEDTLADEDTEILNIDIKSIKEVLSKLGDLGSWPFLCSDTVEPMQKYDIEALESLCVHAEEIFCDVPPVTVPRAFGKHRIVLHLFSGRRRRGDVQYFLDALASQQQHFILHVISLDIIIDPIFGDATNKATCAFWLDHIRRGHIIAMLAGPSCESWSIARGVPLQGSDGIAETFQKRGPRLVRDINELWGFSCVTIRELFQLIVGNSLLGFAILAFLELALIDGHGMIEHPAEPEKDASAASIWRLPLLKAMMKLPGVEFIKFSQGLMGAKSAKPTHLLLLRLPQFLQCLHMHRVRTDILTAASIGRNCQGQWSTAALKEYPPALCKAAAHSFFQAISSRKVDNEVSDPPEAFLAKCRELTITTYGENLGADFAHS